MVSPHSIRVLLVAGTPRLKASLLEAGYEVFVCGEAEDLYALLKLRQPDVVLLSTDSPSRDVLEHLALVNRRHPQPMIVLHSAADADLAAQAVRAGISAYAGTHLSAEALRSLINVSVAQFQHTQALKRELGRAQQALSERKLIDRAKCMLMEQLGLSEADAYERLKKSAMDGRLSVAGAAQKLIQEARESHG